MKTDARIRYTKAIIREKFLTLLAKKPVEKITVTELCEMAQINRATFYSHYNDCYDLLRSIENEFLEQFREMGKTENWCESRELISAICDTIDENMDICEVLIFNAENPTLLTRMIELARDHCMGRWRERFPTLSRGEQDMLFIHLATGLSSVIYNCYRKCPREQLISFLVQITENCLAPFRHK